MLYSHSTATANAAAAAAAIQKGRRMIHMMTKCRDGILSIRLPFHGKDGTLCLAGKPKGLLSFLTTHGSNNVS
jgi:hypothetical protein